MTAVIVLIATIVLVAATRPIPANRQAALKLLRDPLPPLPGRNSHVDAYLVTRAIPLDRWHEYRSMAPESAIEQLEQTEPAPAVVNDAFPECGSSEDTCLQAVRANPERAREVHRSSSDMLRAILEFQSETRHLEFVGVYHFDAEFVPLMGMHAPVRLDAALRVLRGEVDGALGGLCRHAEFWRGLRSRTDMLIVDMMAQSHIVGAAHGVAEILASAPEADVPESCDRAFAPLRDEESMQCRVMRKEFEAWLYALSRFSSVMNSDGESAVPDWVWSLGFRSEASSALAAPMYAAFCDDAHRARISRREMMPEVAADECRHLEFVVNPLGCITSSSRSNHADYYHRTLDLDGRVRLLSTALWLHRTRPPDLRAGFESRPEALRDSRHRIEVSRCSASLSLGLRWRRSPEEGVWRLPLAPASECAATTAES